MAILFFFLIATKSLLIIVDDARTDRAKILSGIPTTQIKYEFFKRFSDAGLYDRIDTLNSIQLDSLDDITNYDGRLSFIKDRTQVSDLLLIQIHQFVSNLQYSNKIICCAEYEYYDLFTLQLISKDTIGIHKMGRNRKMTKTVLQQAVEDVLIQVKLCPRFEIEKNTRNLLVQFKKRKETIASSYQKLNKLSTLGSRCCLIQSPIFFIYLIPTPLKQIPLGFNMAMIEAIDLEKGSFLITGSCIGAFSFLLYDLVYLPHTQTYPPPLSEMMRGMGMTMLGGLGGAFIGSRFSLEKEEESHYCSKTVYINYSLAYCNNLKKEINLSGFSFDIHYLFPIHRKFFLSLHTSTETVVESWLYPPGLVSDLFHAGIGFGLIQKFKSISFFLNISMGPAGGILYERYNTTPIFSSCPSFDVGLYFKLKKTDVLTSFGKKFLKAKGEGGSYYDLSTYKFGLGLLIKI